MKIKLEKPIEYSSSMNSRNMSIGNKNLGDSDQRGANAQQFTIPNNTQATTKTAEVDNTPRVDRIEPSQKIESVDNSTNYSSLVKQRTEKISQYRRDLISQNVNETSTKSDERREKNREDIVEKISSSADNVKRVQKEFTDSKEKLSTKILEQNDSTAQAQATLRESKRKLLAEIQKTTENNSQVKSDLQQNRRELTTKTIEETNKTQSTNETNVAEFKEETTLDKTSAQERKVELLNKVMDNNREDVAIKQKLNQYKRELAAANSKREQLAKETKNTDISLQKVDVDEVKLDDKTYELSKVRELISEQETKQNIAELVTLDLDFSDFEATINANINNTNVNTNTAAVDTSKVAADVKPIKTNSTKNQNKVDIASVEATKVVKAKPSKVIDISSKISPVTDFYESPNLTAFDVATLKPPIIPTTTSASTFDAGVSSIDDMAIASIDSAGIDNVSIISTYSSIDASIDVEKQEIINKISVDSDETTEIQQKLREYQAEVRRINSEIMSLTEESKSTSPLSYKNSTEEDGLASNMFSVVVTDECPEDIELQQQESIIEYANDVEEVEIMLSAQEEMNSVIKILATEIKQEELLAQIAEQEQAIARNKILEKRESLIELAKQNNELLRTLNERLSIITKKVTRNVVYAPTIITQKTRMIA